MKFVERTLSTPAENLACDEALLDECELTGQETLRVWESPVHFVVVGYGNRIETEVDTANCARAGVPVLRRCSGGGTVIQGPGSLSYAICLKAPEEGPLSTVTGTNELVMQRQARALSKALGVEVAVKGCTDLAVLVSGSWVKFSGNSQRRRRHAVLFHGTILHDFDLPLVERLLRFPSLQPDYRAHRPHGDFITNVRASRADLVQALKEAWGANAKVEDLPWDRIRELVTTQYGCEEWIRSR